MRLLTPQRHCNHATNMTQAMPSQRVNAKLRWYTDGSKQVHDDWSYVIGAGVYNYAARGISRSINPRGSGAINTITRAELVASALLLMGQGQDEIIATDSQASICMICEIHGLSTNPAAMQIQCRAEGNGSSTPCPSKKGPANQNSESEIPYRNSRKRGGQSIGHSRHRFQQMLSRICNRS